MSNENLSIRTYSGLTVKINVKKMSDDNLSITTYSRVTVKVNVIKNCQMIIYQ